jgi:UDPglucose 6-dehydrogenase
MEKISVIGIGKLGLCFSLSLESCGYDVLGVDINESYVDALNSKTFNSTEPMVNEMLAVSKNFVATTILEKAVKHSDIIFVVVATPSLPNGRYNHRQIEVVCDKLLTMGAQPTLKHLIINCTTMPKYCQKLQEKVEQNNWTVSYNPEFIAQGTIIANQENPDMVLIGEANEKIGDKLEEIYETMTMNSPRIHRMTPTEAEITKIALNCFLTTKISYTNMIGDIVLASGGRPQTVLNAVGSDTRVGSKLTRYGFGYGGPCFPRDNRAIGIYAKDISLPADISEATDSSNHKHLQFQVSHFIRNHPAETKVAFGECPTEGYVVYENVTYKKGSVMIEESQQLAFAVEIARKGYLVSIYDCKEVIDSVKELYNNLFHYVEV